MGWAERCNKKRQSASPKKEESKYPAIRAGHKHAEAFNYMAYQCENPRCNNRILIYNSRDGVTPFTIGCPNCKGPMSHIFLDAFMPNYALKPGDYYFRDTTREELLEALRQRLVRFNGTDFEVPDEEKEDVLQEIFKHEWREGIPALRVWGEN